MTILRSFACLLGLSSLASCGVLGSPPDPWVVPATTPLSTVAPAPGRAGYVELLCIDGKSTHSFQAGQYRIAAMLPAGRHHFLIRLTIGRGYAISRQMLDVVEGHNYLVDTRVQGYQAGVVLIDESTGKIVRSDVGADDDPPVKDTACRVLTKENFPAK